MKYLLLLLVFVGCADWTIATKTNPEICKENCEKLSKQFFKYEDGEAFGSSQECWCLEGNNTKQIY